MIKLRFPIALELFVCCVIAFTCVQLTFTVHPLAPMTNVNSPGHNIPVRSKQLVQQHHNRPEIIRHLPREKIQLRLSPSLFLSSNKQT